MTIRTTPPRRKGRSLSISRARSSSSAATLRVSAMKIIHNLLELPRVQDRYQEIGLTIGNFDGVHLGHQQLLRKIKSDCVARNLKFVVVTFTPHPQHILRPEKERFLINSYEQR